MKIEIGSGATALTTLALYANEALRADERTEDVFITHVATDSREVTEGTLFLGIRGERVDGNDYCATAFQNGASAVLCERPPETGAAIVTSDTVLALGRIASAVKDRCQCRTVAVTGSVGKTTTKDLLYAVLSQRYKTHSSRGNYNSNIGLPMSILEMKPETEVAVFELGMSAFFEIDYLTRLARPDIGVITNIGTSHMESLGSRENIAKAKLEILNGIRTGGVILLNGDEPLLLEAESMIRARGIRPMYVSIEGCEKMDFRAENIRTEIGQTMFDFHFGETVWHDVTLNVTGKHLVYGAMFASAVGLLSGLSESEIRKGLLAFRSAPMRQSIEKIGEITLIEDCYNASPESMRAALDVSRLLVKKQGSGRVLALLGDMRELGETSDELHGAVGGYAAKTGAELLFTFGETASRSLADGAILGGLLPENVFRFESAEDVEAIGTAVMKNLRSGDVILIKASRALRGERVVAFLKEKLNGRSDISK